MIIPVSLHAVGLSFWRGTGWAEPEDPPFAPSPLPLLNGTKIIEAPTGLDTLVRKYTAFAADFIMRHSSKAPWYLFVVSALNPQIHFLVIHSNLIPTRHHQSFNHIHAPISCGPDWCGKSKHGPIGDAIEETDWAVGQIMAAVKAAGVDQKTIAFFTSE